MVFYVISMSALTLGIEGQFVYVYSIGNNTFGFESVTCDMVKPARGNRGRSSLSASRLKPCERALIRTAGRGDIAG